MRYLIIIYQYIPKYSKRNRYDELSSDTLYALCANYENSGTAIFRENLEIYSAIKLIPEDFYTYIIVL